MLNFYRGGVEAHHLREPAAAIGETSATIEAVHLMQNPSSQEDDRQILHPFLSSSQQTCLPFPRLVPRKALRASLMSFSVAAHLNFGAWRSGKIY